MRNFSFILTPEQVASQSGMTVEEARTYISDLKYLGFFISASNGDAIEVLPPNPDTQSRQQEREAMTAYEQDLKRLRIEGIRQGLINPQTDSSGSEG